MTHIKDKPLIWVSGPGSSVLEGMLSAGPSRNLQEVLDVTPDKHVLRSYSEAGKTQDFQLQEGRLVEAYVTPTGLVAMLEIEQPGHARRAFIERDGFMDWAYLENLKEEGEKCRFYGWGARWNLPDTLAWHDPAEMMDAEIGHGKDATDFDDPGM